MDTSKLMPAAIAAGLLYAVAHFAKNQQIKAAAYGAIGVVVAKQLPYVKDAL